MTGRDVLEALEALGSSPGNIVKWWGNGEEKACYETVPAFRSTVSPEQEIGGYELLDLEQMWDVLCQFCPEDVSREMRPTGEWIVWSHHSGAGEMVVEECPFTPESVMTIYNIEGGSC